jgi:hypothetical protein
MPSLGPSRPAPRIFRAGIPDDGVYFNAEFIVDIFFLAGKPVLSVVDRDTRYQSAIFLPTGTKSLDVWQALLRCWICRYAGAPDSIRTDYGSQFVAGEFKVWSAEMNILCSAVPVESAHSMGIDERYHGPIRRIFERLRLAHPRAPKDFLLDISVKTCNDLTGVDVLVPALLVYGLPEASSVRRRRRCRAPVRKDANDRYRPRRVFTACRRLAP